METKATNDPQAMPRPYADEELKTILDYFYEWESKQPDAPFLRQPSGEDWRSISWAEAGEEARRMCAALQGLGLKPGDKVGLISKNCYHWVIADLAMMMGGFVSVPFYPNLTAGQLRQVLKLSDAKVLFVGKLEEWSNLKGGVPAEVQMIAFPHYPGNAKVEEGMAWNDLIDTYEAAEGQRPGLHDLWTILFTSGTTGMPKGVMHTYYAPASLMHNEKVHNDLKVFEGKEHRYFSYLPLNHIAERIIVEVAAIMTGGTINFAESIDTFAKNLQDTQPTLFMAVPRIWTKFRLAILERMPQKRLSFLLRLPLIGNLVRKKIHKGLGLSAARIMLTGAAPTPDSLKDWYRELGLQLQEVYAMTENCGGCTLMPINGIKSGTVGKGLPNVEIKIAENTGEVLMRAPWVMQGYYRDPEKTAHVLRDGWLHTGDQGELDEEGYLQLTGRVSDTFKSAKGKFIIPAPIEWVFAKNNHIEQVAVVGLAIPQPLALVVLSELGRQASREEVRESLTSSLEEANQDLANYERVCAVIVMEEDWSVDNGILTPTLKIRRDVLNERYQEFYMRWYEEGEPVLWENQK